MDGLKQRLEERAPCGFDTDAALRDLGPQIHMAAQCLSRARQRRRQALGFALAALAMLCCFALCFFEIRTLGKPGDVTRNVFAALGIGTLLTLMLSPVLAYFTEEETVYEEDSI